MDVEDLLEEVDVEDVLEERHVFEDIFNEVDFEDVRKWMLKIYLRKWWKPKASIPLEAEEKFPHAEFGAVRAREGG